MNYIDAHVHVWTDDTAHYPLAPGWKKSDMKPARFTPEDLFKHTKKAGVDRINLIQMSYYGYDNSYMTDMIALYPKAFVGTAVIDPAARDVEKTMTALLKKGVKAFRVYPGLAGGTRPNEGKGEGWLKPAGYARMFAQAAKNGQAISCLIGPDALPDLGRMCKAYPDTPVIIDHLARIGVSGTIVDKEVEALVAMASHKKVLVKVGAFYALGKKKAPYADLGPLIQKVVKAFGPERCMWESDCPFQVVEGHNYANSINLIKTRLKFLTAADREWLLRKTAENFFFKA